MKNNYWRVYLMSYDRVYMWYPRYQKYYDNNIVKKLYKFMSEPENIEKMLIANDVYGRPALAGIISEVEAHFHDPVNFNLNENILKQFVGSMVREIINDFGYDIDRQKSISNTKYIKSATYYKKSGEITKRLVKKVMIEDVR